MRRIKLSKEAARKMYLREIRSPYKQKWNKIVRTKMSDEELSKLLKMPQIIQKELLKKINYITPKQAFLMEMCLEFSIDKQVRVDVVRAFWYGGFFLICDKLEKKIAITFSTKGKDDKRAVRNKIVKQIETLGVKHYNYFGNSFEIKEILEKEFG